jgi:hypothetical protein
VTRHADAEQAAHLEIGHGACQQQQARRADDRTGSISLAEPQA